MATPKDYAENLAIVWEMKDPIRVERMLREIYGPETHLDEGAIANLEERTAGTGIEIYSNTPKSIRERIKGPIGTAVLAMLNDILKGAHITEPCKEFLVDYVSVSLGADSPPERLLPLEQLGISLGEERYGIFDSKEDLRGIERRLLDYHKAALSVANLPRVVQEMSKLNKRWHEAFRKKYESK